MPRRAASDVPSRVDTTTRLGGRVRSQRNAATSETGTRDLATRAARMRIVDQQVRDCTACGLHTHRSHASVGDGPVDADLMVVGLAPGQHEDLRGTPLAGSARNVVEHALRGAGIGHDEVRLTVLVRCRPPADRRPSIAELQACSSHLSQELAIVNPSVVVALGEQVASLLYGRPLQLEQVAGYRLDVAGTTLIPTYDPWEVVHGLPFASQALQRDMATARAVLQGRVASGAQLKAEARAQVAHGTPAGSTSTQPR